MVASETRSLRIDVRTEEQWTLHPLHCQFCTRPAACEAKAHGHKSVPYCGPYHSKMAIETARNGTAP